MLTYANPRNVQDERERADSHGLVGFNETTRQIPFECWTRFPALDGRCAQFPAWPITVAIDANDGRAVAGWLPELNFKGVKKFRRASHRGYHRGYPLHHLRPRRMLPPARLS